MKWLEKMNGVIDYIENHLTENIDYRKVAQIACCPNYHFQRMFTFMTEMTLSEYIRRRRLTLAAFDLQNHKESILDIALKYGYASHSAFTRAFKAYHGASPASVRTSGTPLKAYPPMSFRMVMEGGAEMNYRIEERDAFSVVGYRHQVRSQESLNKVPTIWQEIRDNGYSKDLLQLLEKGPEGSLRGILGILAGGNWGKNDTFSYYTGVPFVDSVPEQMEKVDIPASKWVVFNVPDISAFAEVWKQLYTDWIWTSQYGFADLPAIECYYPPAHHPQNEIWVPIVKSE